MAILRLLMKKPESPEDNHQLKKMGPVAGNLVQLRVTSFSKASHLSTASKDDDVGILSPKQYIYILCIFKEADLKKKQ